MTDKEKQNKGTLQKCRVKNNPTYDPIDKIPSPSFNLTKLGLSYFKDFCSILISNKTLTLADIPGITRGARWFELYMQASKDVDERGPVQITSTGYTQQTGYFTVMEKAEDRVLKFEALYGMNLLSRSKMNLPKTEKKNPFDEV